MLIPKFFLQNQPKCISLKNQKCKARETIIDNDYMTFLYKIKVDKCARSCNDIDHPYFKVCLPETVKNISVKVCVKRIAFL